LEDSSALAERFVDEAGSDDVEDACAQASELGLLVAEHGNAFG
jgi:hypothetical protein